jgi:hypothetical protein
MDFLGSFKRLTEAATKKQKLKGGKGDKLTPDQVNYFEFTKGWKHELEHTDDIDKAKEIALDHLSEDPMYYTRLQMVEFEKKKKERSDLPIDISNKKASVKDEKNQMTPVKKQKKEKSNVSDSGKQEKARSKNAGVKKMKGGSGEMKSLKEAVEVDPEQKAVLAKAAADERRAEQIKKSQMGELEYEMQKSKQGSDKNSAQKDDEKGEFKLSKEGEKERVINITYKQYSTLIDRNKSEKEGNKLFTSISPIDGIAKKIVDKYEQLKKETEKSEKEPKEEKDAYEINFKDGGKSAIAYLTDKEARSRSENPSKYEISSIKKVRGAGSETKKEKSEDPDTQNINLKTYPYYVFDKDKQILIGIADKRAGLKYELQNTRFNNRYSTLSKEQAERKAAKGDAVFIYKYKSVVDPTPEDKNNNYDPKKSYHVVNTKTKDVVGSFDDGEKAKSRSKELNSKDKTSDYEAISSRALDARGFLNKTASEPDVISSKKEIVFSVEDPKNKSGANQQVRDTIARATFNSKNKELTLVMSGGSNLVFTPDASGNPVGVYFPKEGGKRDIAKDDIKDPLKSILKKSYPKQTMLEKGADVDSMLEDYIRQRIRKALKEGDEGPFIGSSGPEVVKKKLTDYLQRYSPDWNTDPSPKQRAIGAEYQGIIAKLVAELNDQEPGLGTNIYKQYTGKVLRSDQADQATPPPQTLAYDPAKLVSRGGRIAENDAMPSEDEIVRDAKRYNDPKSQEFKDALKNLQTLIQDYGDKGKDLPKKVLDALRQMSDINK